FLGSTRKRDEQTLRPICLDPPAEGELVTRQATDHFWADQGIPGARTELPHRKFLIFPHPRNSWARSSDVTEFVRGGPSPGVSAILGPTSRRLRQEQVP